MLSKYLLNKGLNQRLKGTRVLIWSSSPSPVSSAWHCAICPELELIHWTPLSLKFSAKNTPSVSTSLCFLYGYPICLEFSSSPSLLLNVRLHPYLSTPGPKRQDLMSPSETDLVPCIQQSLNQRLLREGMSYFGFDWSDCLGSVRQLLIMSWLIAINLRGFA